MNIFEPAHWESKLMRPLTDSEMGYFGSYHTEMSLNDMVRNLHHIAAQHNLHISKKTEMDGNCLFESLSHLGIHNNAKQLRLDVAITMTELKNSHQIIPGMTLEEAFVNTNEISHIKCPNTGDMIPYTYDQMCHDMLSDGSWERLNTHLILSVMVNILKIQLKIYGDSGSIIVLGPDEPENGTFYLGLLRELHYMPLKKNKPDSVYNVPEITKARKRLERWFAKAETESKNLMRIIGDDWPESNAVYFDPSIQMFPQSNDWFDSVNCQITYDHQKRKWIEQDKAAHKTQIWLDTQLELPIQHIYGDVVNCTNLSKECNDIQTDPNHSAIDRATQFTTPIFSGMDDLLEQEMVSF